MSQSCSDKIRESWKSTREDLEMALLVYDYGERNWAEAEDYRDSEDRFKKRWATIPTEPSRLEVYNDEKADLEDAKARLSDKQLELLENYDRIYGLGGSDALMDCHLSFEFVPGNERDGYFAFIMSTSGPHDELQFHVDDDNRLRFTTYVLKDWFDSAEIRLRGDDAEVAERIYNFFYDSGTVDHVRFEAAQ